jgi:hypothetical protein
LQHRQTTMATSFPKTGPASRGLRAGQRGQASIVVLVLFLAAAAAISAIGTTEHTGNAGRTQVLNRQITDTLSQLSAWYERDGLASLGGTTPDEPALQALLSTKYPALRLAMSTPIVRSGCTTVQDCEPSRQILVWYPATSPQPSAALVNGLPMYQTGGDALWRLYDSKGFVQQRMASAYSQLLGLGRALSAWVTAQQRASVYAQTNYLRASSCSTPGSALPCLSGRASCLGGCGYERSGRHRPVGRGHRDQQRQPRCVSGRPIHPRHAPAHPLWHVHDPPHQPIRPSHD